MTASSRIAASRAPPAPRSSARSPPACRRRAVTAAATSSRSGAGSATRMGVPCDPRTSAPRWSASCASRATSCSSVLRGRRRSAGCVSAGRRAATSRAASRPMRARARSPIHLTRPDSSDSCTPSRRRSRTSCPATARSAPRRAGRRPARARTGSPPGTRIAAASSSATRTSGARPARPAGFVDRIEVELRRRGRMESQIADVQRGRADLAVLANQWVNTVSPERLRALVATLPGSGAQPTGPDHGLDVPQRPAAAVRRHPRAPSGQLSRSTAPASSGWRAVPRLGQPTCQIVPIALPGLRAPLPFHCCADGGWRMDRPRRGAGPRAGGSSPGGRGSASSCTCRSTRAEVGRYFTALLNELGFRAQAARATGPRTSPIYEPGIGAQTGSVGWAADTLSPVEHDPAQLRLRGARRPLRGERLAAL